MVAAIGHFLFHHRNSMFPIACLPLLLPGPDIWDESIVAALCGGAIALSGQIIRMLTIGLRYVIRGGRGRRVYAEDLVTDGLYAHARNPMYLGNLLIVAGVAFASNSWATVGVGIPLGIGLYVCIVAAEEEYLQSRFGAAFADYCRNTPRWFPRLDGLRSTLSGMRFAWRRVLVKEYGTPLGWILVIVGITLFNVWSDGQWTSRHDQVTAVLAVAAITVVLWFVAWRLKKSRTVVAD